MSTPAEFDDLDYLCVGVCMNDPESGYCLGCGRPPLPLADGFSGPPQASSPENESTTTAADFAA